jgi:hypothetical protein
MARHILIVLVVLDEFFHVFSERRNGSTNLAKNRE